MFYNVFLHKLNKYVNRLTTIMIFIFTACFIIYFNE